jgi:restriction system protein
MAEHAEVRGKDTDAAAEASQVGKQHTIVEAIQQVMGADGHPMAVPDIYEAIVRQGLYRFRAVDPAHIVRTQIRRHCVGLDFPSSSRTKLFQMVGSGTYGLLRAPVRRAEREFRSKASRSSSRTIEILKRTHQAFITEFRKYLLQELGKLDPASFERFCRNLLRAYGFREVEVTRVSKDGGIDGYGQLKVGFAYFNVAFQCKRWRGNVGRAEVSQFRGDIQGQYETGIFFTTARFTPDAKGLSMRTGAVPIILVDGTTIVDIMIDKQFGIEKEELPVYTSALDLAIAE